MPEQLVKALRAHRARQLERRLAAGPAWQDNDLVFANTLGKPLEPRAVNTTFKRLLRKASLRASIRFHDLRHACATMLKERGEDLYDISKLLGHSSITITADIYGHITEASRRGVANQMDSILAPRAVSER